MANLIVLLLNILVFRLNAGFESTFARDKLSVLIHDLVDFLNFLFVLLKLILKRSDLPILVLDHFLLALGIVLRLIELLGLPFRDL